MRRDRRHAGHVVHQATHVLPHPQRVHGGERHAVLLGDQADGRLVVRDTTAVGVLVLRGPRRGQERVRLQRKHRLRPLGGGDLAEVHADHPTKRAVGFAGVFSGLWITLFTQGGPTRRGTPVSQGGGGPANVSSVAGQRGNAPEGQADVAQLVAHHLAKVRVAGSNPVVRSERPRQVTCGAGSVEWPRGEATACKAVYTGSNPVSTSAVVPRAIGAAGARFLDTEEVTGSIPVSPTRSEAMFYRWTWPLCMPG